MAKKKEGIQPCFNEFSSLLMGQSGLNKRSLLRQRSHVPLVDRLWRQPHSRVAKYGRDNR